MALTNTTAARYARVWLEKNGPQTRDQLIEGFSHTFVADLATKEVDALFKSEHLLADDDGLIHWAETYQGRLTNAQASENAEVAAGVDPEG